MKTVLLVDDNSDVRELIGFALRSGGYGVREAENGKDALEQLETMPALPALLLLDVMMPVMNGIELLQIISDREDLSDVPVIVLSAGLPQSQVPGAKWFFRKPVDNSALLSLVRDICGRP